MGLEGIGHISLDAKIAFVQGVLFSPPDRSPVQKSVWTADLALMLAKFGIRIRMCTQCVGVNAMLEAEVCVDILEGMLPAKRAEKTYGQNYYRDSFADDGKRVGSLFDVLKEMGVPVENRYAAACFGRHISKRVRLTCTCGQ